MHLVIFSLLYVGSCYCAFCSAYLASGCLLMAAAAGLSAYYYKKSGRLTCPAVIFSLSWIGGCGISCLKLSRLQSDWEIETWLCFYLAYVLFIMGWEIADRALMRRPLLRSKGRLHDGMLHSLIHPLFREHAPAVMGRAVLKVMALCTAVSVAAFAAEALLLGYVPLFTADTPHAYSYFHVSGLHYFTVICVLLPAMAVLYCFCVSGGFVSSQVSKYTIAACTEETMSTSGSEGAAEGAAATGKACIAGAAAASVFAAAGVIVPVLLVSRYQLLFGMLLAAAAIIILLGGRLSLSFRTVCIIAITAAAALTLYVFITIERAHSVEYLNGIFEMKKSDTPIWITQPYMYIANNFDNFNCMVRELEEHSHGLRMLFPVIALTGLKFVRPELCAFPLFVTKEELTTVTLFYDAFYDFGIIGVAVFAFVLGLIYAVCEHVCRSCIASASENRAVRIRTGNVTAGTSLNAAGVTGILLYGQLCIYLALSFFTTWFSNPTTWFYFAVTAVCGAGLCLVKDP
ncbi:MAG: O-antigen ligase [Clostridiales bacterium]|nr:O-antigen ligase [Clostridiales bacterium]